MSHEFFQQKFNIQTPYTTYFGVIDAFPKRWKKRLREPVNTCDSVATIPKWMEDTSRLTNKILYSEIIKNKFVPPTSQRMLLETGVLESEFKMIYTLPYKVTTETKLIMFQLKFVDNILPTNALLSKINLSESDACDLCKAPSQAVPHLFINCNQTVVFWKLFKIWWKNKTNLCIHLLAKQILFGIIDTKETHNLLLNHLLLIAKYYIYSCYLNEQELDFKPYLNIVEKKFIIERQIGLQNREIDSIRNNGQYFSMSERAKSVSKCVLTENSSYSISAVIISIIILFNFDL